MADKPDPDPEVLSTETLDEGTRIAPGAFGDNLVGKPVPVVNEATREPIAGATARVEYADDKGLVISVETPGLMGQLAAGDVAAGTMSFRAVPAEPANPLLGDLFRRCGDEPQTDPRIRWAIGDIKDRHGPGDD